MSTPVAVDSVDARRATQGAVVLGIVQTSGRGLAVVFVVIATRVLAPSEFGRYSLVAGLVALAGFLADFGSTTVITRAVSQQPDASDGLIAQTLLTSVLIGAAAYAAVVVYVVVGPYAAPMRVDILIGGLAIPFDAALTSILAGLDGHGLSARRAVVSCSRIGVIALGGSLALVLTRDVRAAMVAIAAGSLTGVVLGAFAARRHDVWALGLTPTRKRSVWLLKTGLPYALLGGIGAVAARLDLVVLSAVSNTADTARYDLALRGVEAFTALGFALATPTLFILSRRIALGDSDGVRRAYGHAVRAAYLLGLPATIIVIALHDTIARFAFGADYAGSGALLAILATTLCLCLLGPVQSALVFASDVPASALRAGLILLVAVITLDAVLIPTAGPAGAAFATVGADIFWCVLLDRLNRRSLGIRTPLPSRALVVACFAAGAIMALASSSGPRWWGVVAVAALPLALVVFGAVTHPDLLHFAALVAPRRRSARQGTSEIDSPVAVLEGPGASRSSSPLGLPCVMEVDARAASPQPESCRYVRCGRAP